MGREQRSIRWRYRQEKLAARATQRAKTEARNEAMKARRAEVKIKIKKLP